LKRKKYFKKREGVGIQKKDRNLTKKNGDPVMKSE